jgi:hypothetical protein
MMRWAAALRTARSRKRMEGHVEDTEDVVGAGAADSVGGELDGEEGEGDKEED